MNTNTELKSKVIWKEIGETPLKALERLRDQESIEADVPMTYAGRLDPLAEGELLILIGEECKKKEEYLGLDKEYEVEILLGAQTDTGDVMGIMDKAVANDIEVSCSTVEIKKVISKFVGKIKWPYPAFSSKTFNGKPLFLWSLEGKINQVEIPIRESEIYELEILSNDSIKLAKLRDIVHLKINSIKPIPKDVESKRLGADFRRVDVLESWANFFTQWSSSDSNHEFQIIKVRCSCSSGTYMRTLASKIGEDLGTNGLALSIVRTHIVL